MIHKIINQLPTSATMKMGNFEKIFVNSTNHRHRVANNAEILLRHANWCSGDSYLDFGCGVGAAPIHIARSFPLNVTGVDIDADQIQLAREASSGIGNIRFLTNSGTSLPFDDHAFDIVATNKVMHHIPNWLEALDEIHRVLAPGGYLIYSDLVYPTFFADIGSALVGALAGFPTKDKISDFLVVRSYSTIYLSNGAVNFNGVFQK
jgi:ubiquinone/menaquinone biosynthesis C-methylase UbiE